MYNGNIADFNAGSGYSSCSYVVFGKTDTSTINLTSIAGGTGGFLINGQTTSDRAGWSIASAGDVNGDGLSDIVVGAWGATSGSNSETGKTFVVFGKATGNAINLSAVAAGTGGFVINGIGASDHSGYSVASAGDLDGDGVHDLGAGQKDDALLLGEHVDWSTGEIVYDYSTRGSVSASTSPRAPYSAGRITSGGCARRSAATSSVPAR